MILSRAFLYSLVLVVGAMGSTAFAGDLPQTPDSKLTPGAVNPAATKEMICVPGYTSQPGVRNVPESLKKQVFAEYRIDSTSDKFEIDHLISLELGGANDIKNLWPQSYTTTPYNAHIKDALENKLHKMICDGKIDIKKAQQEIARDWVAAYKKYVEAK
jgi:hypothetical protein